MLPAPHRMRRREEFTRTVRRGCRVGRPLLTVHLLPPEADPDEGSVLDEGSVGPTRVGLVVSRAVGSAVVRTTVKRRLRHLLRARIDGLPPGSFLVVRANPAAAGVTSDRLAVDLDQALGRATRPRTAGEPAR